MERLANNCTGEEAQVAIFQPQLSEAQPEKLSSEELPEQHTEQPLQKCDQENGADGDDDDDCSDKIGFMESRGTRDFKDSYDEQS